MSVRRQLGVAVAGLGVGERHARMIASLPDSRLTRIYDPQTEKARAVSAALGAEAAASFDALLDDDRLDVVVVASPDHFHADQIVAAMRSGRHVFAEKPLCNTSAELARIVEAWRSAPSRLQLQSNLVLRAAPLYRWLKEEIRRGTFGEIYAVDGDYLYGRLEKLLEGWRGTGDNYSGIKGGGVHLIDLMCWLTGQKPDRAFTAGNNVCTRGASINSQDYMAATYRFPSGLVGRVTANLGCVHRHHHVLRVFGTRATFIYDDAGARIHLTRDPDARAQPIDLSPLPAGKSDLLPGFLDAVRSGRDTSRETEEEMAAVCICHASDASLRSGREEPIVYP